MNNLIFNTSAIIAWALLENALRVSKCCRSNGNNKRVTNLISTIHGLGCVFMGTAYYCTIQFSTEYALMLLTLIKAYSQGYFIYDARNYFDKTNVIAKGGAGLLIHHILSIILEENMSTLFNDTTDLSANLILTGMIVLEFSNIPHWITYDQIQQGVEKKHLWEWFVLEAVSYLVLRNMFGLFTMYITSSSLLRYAFGGIWLLSIYWGILCTMLACKYIANSIDFKQVRKNSFGF